MDVLAPDFHVFAPDSTIPAGAHRGLRPGDRACGGRRPRSWSRCSQEQARHSRWSGTLRHGDRADRRPGQSRTRPRNGLVRADAVCVARRREASAQRGGGHPPGSGERKPCARRGEPGCGSRALHRLLGWVPLATHAGSAQTPHCRVGRGTCGDGRMPCSTEPTPIEAFRMLDVPVLYMTGARDRPPRPMALRDCWPTRCRVSNAWSSRDSGTWVPSPIPNPSTTSSHDSSHGSDPPCVRT